MQAVVTADVLRMNQYRIRRFDSGGSNVDLQCKEVMGQLLGSHTQIRMASEWKECHTARFAEFCAKAEPYGPAHDAQTAEYVRSMSGQNVRFDAHVMTMGT